jgi:acid phosphatase type 7
VRTSGSTSVSAWSECVGTGGAGLYDPGTSLAPNSELLETGTHGVLKLTLSWSGYAWQFLPAGDGTFTDSGTGACH